jgi:hypothetical protein
MQPNINTTMSTFISFYPMDRFMYNGNKGTVIHQAEIDEGGADFYFAEINYVVQMDDESSPVTYNIRGIKIMTQNHMVKI